MQICHEHSRLTLNSTSDYRRFVVHSMCIDCYPKMQKTTKRGNMACWIFIVLSVLLATTLIIINKAKDSEVVDEVDETSDVTLLQVFDPVNSDHLPK